MRTPKLIRVLAMTLAVVALYAIGPWCWNVSLETVWKAHTALTAWRNSSPARPLPLRPGDREHYPRRGFGLALEYERGFRVDTFAGTATKDLIQSPDTTVALRLSEAQLDTLYDAVIRMRLFDFPAHPRSYGTWASSETVRLLVQAGEARRVLAWSAGSLWSSEPIPDDWKRLHALERMIGRMVTTHPAYRALPPPKGIYID